MTGDLLWQYNRDRPDDLADYMIGTLLDVNRNVAIYGKLIIDTSMDDHIFALTPRRAKWSGRRRSLTTR